MKINETRIDGLFVIESNIYRDIRGEFQKKHQKSIFSDYGLEPCDKEAYYSISKKNVLRGMHYQSKPYQHSKHVWVCSGCVLDVVIDVRSDSKTFGEYFVKKLNDYSGESLYLAPGLAHGFLTLSERAIMMYMTSSEHHADSDTGVRWNSFGLDWNEYCDDGALIISERDKTLPELVKYAY